MELIHIYTIYFTNTKSMLRLSAYEITHFKLPFVFLELLGNQVEEHFLFECARVGLGNLLSLSKSPRNLAWQCPVLLFACCKISGSSCILAIEVINVALDARHVGNKTVSMAVHGANLAVSGSNLTSWTTQVILLAAFVALECPASLNTHFC